MEEEEIVTEPDTDSQSQKPKISRLALTSMVFGILGPLVFGVMWIVSFLPLRDLITASPYITIFFACGAAWISGLVLGIKSLGRIENSKGRLAGRGYAIAGIVVSAAWAFLILGALFLPVIYYVNS